MALLPHRGTTGQQPEPPELDDDSVLRDVLHEASRLVGHGTAVVVLHGPPGIGKFTRANRAALQLRRQLGAVLMELRPGRTPSGAANEFRELLSMLGARALLPLEMDADHLSEEYAKVTERVKTVLLLDDVADWDQVQPLLPAGSDGLVIATSLAPCPETLGLAAGKVVNIPVEGPDLTGCVEAFREAAGARGGRPSRDMVVSVVEQCFRSPLAIQLTGALYAHHTGLAVPDLVKELRRRLSERKRLPLGNHPADADLLLWAVLDWACEDLLEPEHRGLLEVLSLPETSTVGVHTAAELFHRKAGAYGPERVEQVAALLRDLADRYFLELQGRDRFRISSAVRQFAAYRLSHPPDADEPGSKVAPLILRAAYCRLTLAARPAVDGHLEPLPPFADSDSALGWLAEEKGAVIRALQIAERVDPGITLDVIKALCTFFVTTGDLNSLSMLEDVVDKESTGRRIPLGENGLLRSVRCAIDMAVGIGARRDGQLTASYEQLRAVRERYAEDNNGFDEAWALRHIGVTLHYMGDFAPAMRYLRRARDQLAPLDHLGNPEAQVRMAWVLHGLGALYADVGAFDEARRILDRSLELHQLHRGVRGRSWAQLVLASCCTKADDDPSVALGLLTRAAEGFEQTGDQAGLAWVRLENARSQMALGRLDKARRELREALDVLEPSQEGEGETARPGAPHVWIDRRALAWTRFEYARCLRHPYEVDLRAAELAAARRLFEEIGDRYGARCAAAEQSGRTERPRRSEVTVPEEDEESDGGEGEDMPNHQVDPVCESRCYIEASVLGDVPVVLEQPYRIRLDVQLDQDLVEALETGSEKDGQLKLLTMAPYAKIDPPVQMLQPVGSQWPLTADIELESQLTGPQHLRFVLITAANDTVLQDVRCQVEVCRVEPAVAEVAEP
ncbi:tetratricopeptide repeat protein [Streptomyces sp. NPDC050504]|uniref:tetratricopeptide repeat protein n=1 Tax=Streptomyces sp. NPDC050504 TaxID=3365618 RepID=UPI003796568D